MGVTILYSVPASLRRHLSRDLNELREQVTWTSEGRAFSAQGMANAKALQRKCVKSSKEPRGQGLGEEVRQVRGRSERTGLGPW